MSSTFIKYLNPNIAESAHFDTYATKLNLSKLDREAALAFLSVLKAKDRATYEHSIRVGILASDIAEFMHIEPKALFYAGLLHDSGKALTKPDTLQKTQGWTAEDTAEMSKHVMDGYRLLRGRFDFSAEIVLWHHRFQPNGYPESLPPHLHEYSLGTKVLIPLCGRILAIADTFDALHRINDKIEGGPPTGQEIREKMLAHNKDMRVLIQNLFAAGILTTKTYPRELQLA